MKAKSLAETCGTDHEDRLSAQRRLNHGQLAVPEKLQPEETESRSEVTARFRDCALSVQPKREPHRPPFYHATSQPAGKFRMMGGMVPVAQGHQICRLIGSARGSRQQVMHVGVSIAARNSARHAAVVIAEENARPDVGPVGRGGLYR